MTRFFAGMALAVLATPLVLGAGPDGAEFEALAARYHQILVKRPSRGATFDLWYRHYLDAGRLEDLFRQVEDDAAKKPDAYAAQMILGLVEERRGRDDEAAQAYERAGRIDPKRFEPPFLRGLLLARLSRIDESVGALGEAMRLDPPRGEFLEIAKRLGQLQIRQGKARDAIATWSRLTERFPNDRRVLAELAELLTDEAQYDEAIRRWEQVADASGEDRHARLAARVAIAHLQLRKGNPETALRLFDQALDLLDPESWQARDVVRRIEAIFQQRNDPAGQVDYFVKRTRERPDDVSTRIQLAAALAKANRGEEAIREYRAVNKAAPGRRDLREALIEELTRLGHQDEALAEARTLAEAFPREVEVLKRLGRLVLSAAPAEKRRDAEAEACRVWSRIAALRPDDPDLALQVAETCRQAALSARSEAKEKDADEAGRPLLEAAEASYVEAVRRAPGAPSYREYLGEFLHARGRRDEALAAWRAMAEPPRDSPENLRQLADVLDRFGFLKEAIAAGEQALVKNPDNLDARMRQARLLIKDKEYERALAQVDQIDRLAEGPVQVEKSLQLRVEALAGAKRVEEEVARLKKPAGPGPPSTRDRWLLGLSLNNLGRNAEAARVFDLAAGDPRADARLLQAAADAHLRASDRLGALRIYRRLVERDPKGAVAHYEKIAELELEVGGVAAAREAAEALIRRAPADLDGYRLRAEIAFKLNDVEDGLQSLLRGVRVAPRDASIRWTLAAALVRAGRLAEASEHYWRSFEIAGDLPDKLTTVAALAELAVASQGQDRLLGELRRFQRGQGDPKVATLCLVEALKTFRDLPAARQELEKLADTRPDDRDVLRLLATMADEQHDWKSAVRYQERLVALAPDRANLESLIAYYQRTGERSKAGGVLLRLLEESHDPDAFIAAVERELKQQGFKEAVALAESGRAKWPDAWPLHFQAGLAHLALGNRDEADECFRQVLDRPRGVFPRTYPGASGGPASSPRSRPIVSLPPPALDVNVSALIRPTFNEGPLDNLPPGEFPDLDDLRLAGELWSAFQTFNVPASPRSKQQRTAQQAQIRSQAGTPARSGWQPSQGTAQQAQIRSQMSAVQQNLLVMQRRMQAELARHQNQASLPEDARQRLAQMQRQVDQWKQMHQNLQRQVVGVTPLDLLAIPKDESTARVASLVGRLVAASKEGVVSQATWIARLRKEAETDPDRARDLVLVYLALDRPRDAREVNQQIAQARPDDPFPHVTRLFLIGTYAPWKSASREAWKGLPASERARMRDEAMVSFRWLSDHRPRVRFELARQFGQFLIHGLGDAHAVAPILAPMIPSAERLDDLAGLVELSASAGDIPLQRAAFSRALELAAMPGDPLTTLTSLKRIAESSSSDARDEGFLADLLSILDVCLKVRLPEGIDPTASTASQPTTAPTVLPPAFPRPGPILDALRLDVLRRTFDRFAAAKKSDVLATHLEREAREGDESLRPAYRLARVSLEWWSGSPRRSLDLLEQFDKEAPEDGGIGLALAQGHLAAGDVPGATRVLARIRPTSEPVASEVDRLRAEISAQLLNGDSGSQVRALLLSLSNQSRAPELTYLFEDTSVATAAARRLYANQKAQLRAVQAVRASQGGVINPAPGTPARGQIVINNVRIAVPNQTVTTHVPPLSVRRILELAKVGNELDDIEKAASAQWEKHPDDSRLGALVALARFARPDLAGAAKAAERWETLLKANPEIGGQPEAAWLASRCLVSPETRALGRRIGREVVANARVRNFGLQHRYLLVQLLQAAVEDGQTEEAIEELQLLKGLTGFNQGALY